jgi:hypothetical protein
MNFFTRAYVSMQSATQRVAEMIIPTWALSFTGLRSNFRATGTKFWGTHPAYEGTVVNYNFARSLYRNDSADKALGAIFAKPIVNLQVSFMGLPRASSEDNTRDDFINDAIHIYWTDGLQQMFRDAMRDSKVIVRMRRPKLGDPLMTMEEREHCTIECLPPERVTILREMTNAAIIQKAIVHHRVEMIEESGQPEDNVLPRVREHEVLEIVTKDKIQYYDQTDRVYLEELEEENRAGFVPFLEVYNDYDAALQGGQSEFEGVYPLIGAFHDVLNQSLMAHKYHSVPKAKFKLQEIGQFIKNNFPDAIDSATGQLKPQSTISWKGREIIFLSSEEDVEFLEARSVLGDSKQLLEFLIDCICIASETPEWAFMRVDSGSANSDRNAQTVPFLRKISKKRRQFQSSVQDLVKMLLVMDGRVPVRVSLTWEPIRPDDELVWMQAVQQLIMGLEVAKQSGIISDESYREMLRIFVPVMKNPTAEERDARNNLQAALAAPALNGSATNGAGQTPISAGPQGRNE